MCKRVGTVLDTGLDVDLVLDIEIRRRIRNGFTFCTTTVYGSPGSLLCDILFHQSYNMTEFYNLSQIGSFATK